MEIALIKWGKKVKLPLLHLEIRRSTFHGKAQGYHTFDVSLYDHYHNFWNNDPMEPTYPTVRLSASSSVGLRKVYGGFD